ncbi:MAG: isoleucine--tRNA ligase [Verrucomicrobia bacterium CG_4_10_14_3_um_filter_43_23]|nr:MAG: isoleucine--tRNA ligase [Verrucomicrobia bacterium CG1_02_43_26]PIP59771.1 MAG: isoleucine--tRNA ligase [Verrucomicrobia bacterium CG22_combo_CG10-13_8_21_14_all_43_17]PIX58760.1 MAG: isoleucine--tRNA ligase [Verrucomicrobia bacterium CG_4_10_14_3_um_filter_43_23]PIY61113.1 MAG: isoleucine--tRNA ligase [Verrucomicrobia bacterium CG_4_10_14_0_8_um_filter_43_34]PJA43519.1 MAG: isoleucine--tRNA ligase [Verrucomicrobia bacterium CG_4_9_14_3_um_filter_43_20]
MSDNLKDTLNLPVTDFPMRASLVEREPKRIEHWDDTKLYYAIQENNEKRDKGTFVLHDGPPFTNGDIHIGTASNKILKDVILRYKSMQGYKTPYIPGWDCHGLPIEHKVAVRLQEEKKELCPLDLRKECAKFSQNYIDIQTRQFKRLGVLADWKHEYKTMDPAYEADVLRTFASFVEHNLVYRSKKPVYWSIPCKTALAEFEIEYKDHVSDSVWVKFNLKEPSRIGYSIPVSLVIWTTTPWTLPANLAVAVHPELDYQLITHDGTEAFLVAKDLADTFIKTCKLENVSKGVLHKGKDLEGLITAHPFIDRESPVITADYVTTESGTGCVHTAPGHGLEDYLNGINFGLEPYCPVDDNGKYVDDGQIPAELVGVAVLAGNNKCPANEAVLKLLTENNALLHQEKCHHTYPYCWRSKTPVIYRALDQWFVSLDKSNVRTRALEVIDQVTWIPDWGKNRITGAVTNRPDWCISRQRTWGVPIPCFYDEAGNALMDSKVILALADKIEKGGTDIWFSKSAEELLNGIDLPKEILDKKLTKGMDTLDVWIESGSSHRAVVQKNKELSWPADLYFEGSDQHRGWFQSSLLTGVIADSAAPFKTVITHGFIVDEQKKKISKSDGKPQTADSYINTYGADVMRLWICSEDYRSDIPFSEPILKHIVQTYRTIRNTLRFQLGNLYDFDHPTDAIPLEDLTYIDKWALHETAVLIEKVSEAYENYEFHRAYQLINRFCAVTLSAIYHDILKDRLYTYAPNWPERRSSQTVIYEIFNVLVRLLAPILSFTADEAFSFFTHKKEYGKLCIHLEAFPAVNEDWKNPEIAEDIEKLFKIRSLVNEHMEDARQKKLLGQSLDAKVTFSASNSNDSFKLLQRYIKELPEFFIVSQAELNPTSADELTVAVTHAEGVRCPRSWRWVPSLVKAEGFGEVSPRCKEALASKYSQNTISPS